VATRGRDEWYAGLTPGLTPGPTDRPTDRPTDATGAGPDGIPVRRGRMPTIAVQFTPPAGVQPGLVGTIIDESADTVDVSATVIDLAVRGFLRIEEVKEGMFSRTDWHLVQLAPPAGQTLRPYEVTLLQGIFRDGPEVMLSQLKNHFASTLSSVRDQMYGEVLDRQWFRKSPQTQRAIWRGLGFFLVGAGFVATFAYGTISRGIDRASGLSLPIPSG